MYITNPTLPYCVPIGTRLTPGSLIRISGTVSSYATCFAINLQCGPNVNPRDDVALHLSPVFSPPPRIVRNSISSNRWGPEESFGGFPLSPGAPFEFLILVEPAEFKIALNGMHFTEFRHRIPFERITDIAIDGDCQINVMSVEGSPYASASAPPMESMPMAGGAPPYPVGGLAASMPPYPSASGPSASGGMYPSIGATSSPYLSQPGVHPYVPPSMPPGGMSYPSTTAYPASSGPYPGSGYPTGPYPSGPGVPPPPPGYPVRYAQPHYVVRRHY